MGIHCVLTNHLNDELLRIAIDEWPDPFRGENGWEYRQLVLEQFLTRTGTPEKEYSGQGFRTKKQTRLDRAWTDVAETVDRSPATVREVVLRMYDGDPGEYTEVTRRFLESLKAIEEKHEG